MCFTGRAATPAQGRWVPRMAVNHFTLLHYYHLRGLLALKVSCFISAINKVSILIFFICEQVCFFIGGIMCYYLINLENILCKCRENIEPMQSICMIHWTNAPRAFRSNEETLEYIVSLLNIWRSYRVRQIYNNITSF